MSNSLREKDMIPKAFGQRGLRCSFQYSGPSMQPTFQSGELLYVRPLVHKVKPGDVVVYEQEGCYVVHRVFSVGKGGYVTRGDSNRFSDPITISPGQVVGRVETVEGLNGVRSVRGGLYGLLVARLGWALRRSEQVLRVVFGWPYRLLKANQLMVRFWKPEIVIIHLQVEGGPLVKYLHRGRTVAYWEPLRGRFLCRKPFDLVLFPPAEHPDTSVGTERQSPG